MLLLCINFHSAAKTDQRISSPGDAVAAEMWHRFFLLTMVSQQRGDALVEKKNLGKQEIENSKVTNYR